MKWVDLTKDLTKKGREELKTGQILGFDFEGSKTWLRIVRKSKGKVWAKEIETFRPEEVDIVDKK